MDEQNWDKLISNIVRGNAVLLLGHGIFNDLNLRLSKHLKQKLDPGEKEKTALEEREEKVFSYEKDGLFWFSNPVVKHEAQWETISFYKDLEVEAELLKKMVQMPFKLIISANPDTQLRNAFTKFKVPHQFDYYSSNFKEIKVSIDPISLERPLVYNLCGSVEDWQSLILDYDDLFKMLRNLLNDVKVDESVRNTLLTTTTYIFVGFHFERWYTQLFMRYLNMYDNSFQNASSNYVFKSSFINKDSQKFFQRQFNVQFIGADISFFEELFNRFATTNPKLLRKLVDELSPTAVTIIQLIEQSNYPAAFAVIKGFSSQLGELEQKALIGIESRYSTYEKQEQSGTVSHENLKVELAQIRESLISLAKKLT